MGLLPPRIPEQFNFATPQEALDKITSLCNSGQFDRSLDAIAEVVKAIPQLAIPFLTIAWSIYQSFTDRSRYALYQSRCFNFGIKPGDKVLDIGSGHIPFPLATHLADISLHDGGVGRAGTPFKYVKGKPVFECNIENTPFIDKEFDFVYCSHVLEHAENPDKACRELMRIAKRGYIETPNKSKDCFLGGARISNHFNYVELIDEVLTFSKYQDWQLDGIGCDILLQMHVSPQTDREKAFSALVYLYPMQINAMLLWEDDFKYKIV